MSRPSTDGLSTCVLPLPTGSCLALFLPGWQSREQAVEQARRSATRDRIGRPARQDRSQRGHRCDRFRPSCCTFLAWIHRCRNSWWAGAVVGPGWQRLWVCVGGVIETARGRFGSIGRTRAAGQACLGRLALARSGRGSLRGPVVVSGGVGDAAQPRQGQLEPRHPRPAGRAGRAGCDAGSWPPPPPDGRPARWRRPSAAGCGARVAATSQAALALNLPDGQCRRPTPALRSRMHNSTTAWRRWSASSQTAVPTRSVTNAWSRQLGNSSAWAPIRRVRRTISRSPW